MPSVAVYIRQEDMEKWSKIVKKSQWLHDQLAGAGTLKMAYDPVSQTVNGKPVKGVLATVANPIEDALIASARYISATNRLAKDHTFVVQTKKDSEDYTMVPPYLGGKAVQDPSPVEQALLDSLPVTPGCCLLKTPCKHWVWQGEQMAYVNTISGEIRSVDV